MLEQHEAYWIGRLAEFCNVSLFHAGRLRNDSGTVWKFRGYNCWHIVTHGEGYVISKGKKYRLNRGDLFSVMEDSEIEYGTESDEGWEFYYLRIEGPLSKEMTGRIGFSPESPVVRLSQKEMVISRFKELLNYTKSPEYDTEFLAGQVLLLYHSLTEDFSVPQRRSSEEIAAEADKIIKNPYTSSVNVNELASMLHISRGKLFSVCKEVCGKSPHEVLQEARLKRICELLKNSDLPLAQLARQTAFQNEKYLIRFFRKYMGISPGKYRKLRNHF